MGVLGEGGCVGRGGGVGGGGGERSGGHRREDELHFLMMRARLLHSSAPH